MPDSLHAVRIIGTGSFLPNDPVTVERIDAVLGPLDQAPARVRSFIDSVGKRMVEGGGVVTRHFAVNPETHALTHTVASLAEPAARSAIDMAGISAGDIDLLILSSPNYDHITPPTTTILQQRLGIDRCAEMEVHSNCAGVGKSVQIASDALRLGRYRTALVVYSQLSSVYLRACFFNQSQVSKTQATLRYILADGAGALVLRGEPGQPKSQRVLGSYVESIGTQRPPGMTAGGGVADVVEGRSPAAVIDQGQHHLDQDFAAVNRDAGPLLLDGICRMLDTSGVPAATIRHFVVSIPTLQLYNDGLQRFCDRLAIVPDQLKFRGARTGYCGGASILVHFDEMVRSGELRPGERAVLHSVESSKWMSAGFIVEW